MERGSLGYCCGVGRKEKTVLHEETLNLCNILSAIYGGYVQDKQFVQQRHGPLGGHHDVEQLGSAS